MHSQLTAEELQMKRLELRHGQVEVDGVHLWAKSCKDETAASHLLRIELRPLSLNVTLMPPFRQSGID